MTADILFSHIMKTTKTLPWISHVAFAGLLMLALMGGGCVGPKSPGASSPSLSLSRTFSLPSVRGTRPNVGVPGRIDHLAYDPVTQRLFVAALENGSLEVIDLASGRLVRSIPGLPQSQGAAVVPADGHVAVTSGRNGLLHIFDTRTLEELRTVEAGPDADNVRYDARNHEILVSYGSTNSGAIAVFDARTWTRLRDITFPSRPESFQVDPAGDLLFANLPRGVRAVADGAVASMNRRTGQAVETLRLEGRARNFPMAYDAAHGRLFIASRRPARLIAIDVRTCAILDDTPCIDDSDDLFYDAQTRQVLVIGGGFRPDLQAPGDVSPHSPPAEMGGIDIFAVGLNGSLKHRAVLPTAIHARTGLFVPARRALYLAVPMRGERDAEIREYTLH